MHDTDETDRLRDEIARLTHELDYPNKDHPRWSKGLELVLVGDIGDIFPPDAGPWRARVLAINGVTHTLRLRDVRSGVTVRNVPAAHCYALAMRGQVNPWEAA